MTIGLKPKHKTQIGLVAILLSAFLLRLMAVHTHDLSDLTVYSENGQIAANLMLGRGYTFDFYGLRPAHPLRSFVPPLYTGVVLLCLKLFKNPGYGLGVIHALLSTLTIAHIFYLTLKLSANRVMAFLATIGVAYNPVFILSIVRPYTLTLNIYLLSLLLVVSVVLKERKSFFWASVTGVILGIALHSRPMLIMLLPMLIVWLWLNSSAEKAKILQLSLVITLAMILVITPWSIYNYQVHHRFVFMSTNSGFTFWNGNNSFTTGSGLEVYTDRAWAFMGRTQESGQPAVQEMFVYPLPAPIQAQIDTIDELALDHQLYQAGWTFIKTNPSQAFWLFVSKFQSFVWFRTNIGARYDITWIQYYKYLYAALLVPFLIGLVLSLSQWRVYALFYMLFAYYTAFYTYFHVQTRFRWEIEGCFFIFAALALYRLSLYAGYSAPLKPPPVSP